MNKCIVDFDRCARSRKQETGSKQEAGSRKQEAGRRGRRRCMAAWTFSCICLSEYLPSAAAHVACMYVMCLLLRLPAAMLRCCDDAPLHFCLAKKAAVFGQFIACMLCGYFLLDFRSSTQETEKQKRLFALFLFFCSSLLVFFSSFYLRSSAARVCSVLLLLMYVCMYVCMYALLDRSRTVAIR